MSGLWLVDKQRLFRLEAPPVEPHNMMLPTPCFTIGTLQLDDLHSLVFTRYTVWSPVQRAQIWPLIGFFPHSCVFHMMSGKLLRSYVPYWDWGFPVSAEDHSSGVLLTYSWPDSNSMVRLIQGYWSHCVQVHFKNRFILDLWSTVQVGPYWLGHWVRILYFGLQSAHSALHKRPRQHRLSLQLDILQLKKCEKWHAWVQYDMICHRTVNLLIFSQLNEVDAFIWTQAMGLI